MCLFKRKEPEFRSDCFPKVMYMCRVINSCVTVKQLEAIQVWAYRILNVWESRDIDIASKRDLSYEWVKAVHNRYTTYYSYINRTLIGTAEKLGRKDAQDKEHEA